MASSPSPTGSPRPSPVPARRPAFGFEPLPVMAAALPADIRSESLQQWDGAGVRVGIIDSGVDARHPAVLGVQGYAAIKITPKGPIYETEPHADAYGHGTACAGIVRSLAPKCEIYSIKVLGAGLIGSGAAFAAGLKWAIENRMHVCNLSLGTTKRDFFALLHELADEAYFKNQVLVTAANNMPTPSFPSMYASVISVAAHDEPDPYCFYLNPTPPIELAAYGINVRVAWQNDGYMTTTGNSFAAPHITGLVAKIMGRYPGLAPHQVKSLLCSLARNVETSKAGSPLEAAQPRREKRPSRKQR